MKLPLLTRWLLRHFTPAPIQDQLTGDLLEEMHAGRSRLWLWRQTFAAVAIGKRSLAAHYVQAAIFSFVWCLPFPALLLWWHQSNVFRAAFARFIQFDWPYSAIAILPLELAPLLLPLWSGVAIYLCLHSRASHRVLRTLCGWLVGLPAFLLIARCFGWHNNQHYEVPAILHLLPHTLLLLPPFVVSLFVSILAAMPLPLKQALRTAR